MVNEFHGYMHLVFNPAGTQMGKNVRGLNCEPKAVLELTHANAVDFCVFNGKTAWLPSVGDRDYGRRVACQCWNVSPQPVSTIRVMLLGAWSTHRGGHTRAREVT